MRLVLACLAAAAALMCVQPAAAQDAARCASLTAATLPPELASLTTRITGAEHRVAVTAPRPLPEHCEVTGSLRQRVGADGQPYAVKFRLRLPAAWNGRFFFEGGGGSNGVVTPALGELRGGQSTLALALGYAVASTDAGHDNAVNRDPARQGVLSFGFDHQARLDYGHAAYPDVTRVAKALIAARYGSAPAYSYYVGCSKGGQEGMMMSQRSPDLFDGVLAGAPGFALPKAALAQAWNFQQFAEAARRAGQVDAAGLPLINRAFSDADLALVAGAVLKACDGLDGAQDGMVANHAGCTERRLSPELALVTCRAGKTDACLRSSQVAAFRRVFTGEPGLYAPWLFDAGIGGQGPNGYFTGWRDWQLGAWSSAVNNARNVTLGGPALSAVFTTPPTPLADTPEAYVRWGVDFDVRGAGQKVFATTPEYPVSAWDFMQARSTDRTAFRRRGGKLIIFHGASDPVFSAADTVDWWRGVDERDAFTRLYLLPGMAHCGGGPATGEFDLFTALVAWVEQGQSPGRIIARAGDDTPWPGRTRPLCPYPTYAAYRGRGDVEEEASFECLE